MKGITVKELFDLENKLVAPLFDDSMFAFEVLPKIGDFIKKTGPLLDEDIYENKGESIWIAKSPRILWISVPSPQSV